jgi:hypothetical protein
MLASFIQKDPYIHNSAQSFRTRYMSTMKVRRRNLVGMSYLIMKDNPLLWQSPGISPGLSIINKSGSSCIRTLIGASIKQLQVQTSGLCYFIKSIFSPYSRKYALNKSRSWRKVEERALCACSLCLNTRN